MNGPADRIRSGRPFAPDSPSSALAPRASRAARPARRDPRPAARVLLALGLALVLALVAGVGAPTAALAERGPGAPARAPQTTLQAVERELMCSTCGVPLNQSDAPQAQQERQTIERLIAQGRTKDEIVDEMVEIYSESVLIDPPDRAVRTVRWLVPTVVAVIALLTVLLLVRRWRRAATAADAPTTGPEPDGGPRPSADASSVNPEPTDDDGLDPADRRRLDDDMARHP